MKNAWEIPAPRNNFNRFPTLWNYDNYYDAYCTNGSTVLSDKNIFVGTVYVFVYLFFASIYTPVLIVMYRSNSLFQHTSYKLMFGIGIIDIVSGFVFNFMAGVMSITGMNYCDNNTFMILIGYIGHACWGIYSMFVIVLALNRCIDMYSKNAADALFSGKRLYLWGIPVLVWFYIFASNWDMPPIYSSYFNTWIFTIDFRAGAPAVNNWICFLDCWFLVASLILLYSLLFYAMHRQSHKSAVNETLSALQKKVFIQTFWICFSVFVVAVFWGVESWFRVPAFLTPINTIVLHICTGSPGIVYLLVNKTIRRGVVALIFGNQGKIDDNRNVLRNLG
ncbi:serpentine type 7TM GPCR chemoreceptor srt domain-containing protein [Ditylenchus destructor]|nr:serpentine type 7TM GPCR chemoreceptor srt domain-containing protein [Ditylenchus destructor]